MQLDGKHPARRRHIITCALVLAWATHAAPGQTTVPSLADLSIEDLINIEITSVGKKEMPLFRSPAAIAVVSGEDLRRRGITTLPEALRGVPGMHVARVDANTWAVAARGLNLEFAKQLLVLQDGRSIYTPSFGGVDWTVQDVLMEDLERIEVIRGPGATLWGANAVNGVINITTKAARETQGTILATTWGTEDRPGVAFRHGGALAADLFYRVYLKYFDRAGLSSTAGGDLDDDWDATRGGFRADWTPSTADLVTLQGDLYALHTVEVSHEVILTPPFSEIVTTPNRPQGGNLTGRWTRTFSAWSRLSLQAYVDRSRTAEESRETADVQLEHRFEAAPGHDLVWGLGYRFTQDEFASSPNFFLTPAARELDLFTGFVQDEITLVPDRWHLTVGSKLEHNDVTGLELQPGLRVLWTPSATQSFWASAARAVSTPARFYRDARKNLTAFQPPFSPVMEVAFINNPDLESEVLDAFEAGWRFKPRETLSVDVAAFHQRYRGIIGPVDGVPFLELEPAPAHLVLPLDFANSTHGASQGVEVAVQWFPVERWQLTAAYSYLRVHLEPDRHLEHASPRHQMTLRSYLTLPGDLELNGTLAYTDAVQSLDNTGETTPIPAYWSLDLGLVWRRSQRVEAGLWAGNLLDPGHPEFTSQSSSLIAQTPRTLTGRLTLRF